MSSARSAILRTLCFHEAWSYAPTLPELVFTLDAPDPVHLRREEVLREIPLLKKEGLLVERAGRFGFADSMEPVLEKIRTNDALQPRKRRRAVRIAKWLSRFSGVRFVALANTTALGHARDGGDLDFLVVVKKGSIWSTRLLSTGPIKVLGLLPKGEEVKDAVCLSYFITDETLDLSSHMLATDDPYFRFWFLSLVPLYSDGVLDRLWEENRALRRRHPFAREWMMPPDLRVRVPKLRIPHLDFFEPAARSFQKAWFPKSIKTLMNLDTRVVVTDRALKLHVDDGREGYREKYQELCRKRGVETS